MIDFPKNINLSTDVKTRLISYLNTEIEQHRAERGNWVTEITDLQQDYLAQPAVTQQTFPFKGACNIIVPLTAIAVEAVHAREMTTLFALDQFVTLKLPPDYDQATADTEKIIDDILIKQVDFYKFADSTLLAAKKFGTTIGKSGYDKVVKRAVKYEGEHETAFDVVVKQGPTADFVQLANFLMPFVCDDPQTAPWCGEEHTRSPYHVKLLAESGILYPDTLDKIEQYIQGQSAANISSDVYKVALQDFQKQTPIQWPREISWFEIWMSFDVDGDGKDEEIVLHYHYESQTLLSVRYNYYEDLHRPYRIGIYFPLEGRWAGIGIGKQNEQFQKEVTTQHRQRIDNATLANLRMFKVKQGLGYGPNEPLFAGKIWEVENKDDVESFQMAEVYPSSYNNEQQAVVYSNQRTGVNELTLGMPQVGTPGTATSDLSRVQEASRKFDYTYKNSKRFLLSVVGDVLCNVSQYGPPNPRIFSTVQNGEMVQQLLTLPHDDLKTIVLNDLALAGQNANRLIDRNSWTQISQVTQQYLGGIFQLLQMMGPMAQTIAPLIAMRGMLAVNETYKQILEAYDVRSMNKLVLPIEQLLPILERMMQSGPPQPQAIGPGNSGSQSPSQAQGMGGNNQVSK